MKRKEEWEIIPIIAIDTNIVIRAFKGEEECKNIINNKICSFCSNRDWIIIMATAGFWRIWLIQFFFIRMFYCKHSQRDQKKRHHDKKKLQFKSSRCNNRCNRNYKELHFIFSRWYLQKNSPVEFCLCCLSDPIL